MSENWNAYMSQIEENVVSFVLDMDVWQEVDMEEYAHAASIMVGIKNPDENGFATGKEADQLNDMEDELIQFVSEKGCINVGRVTFNGIRDIVFYSSDALEEELNEAAEQFFRSKGYEYEVRTIEEERSWQFYFEFLYPDEFQQQYMGNRIVIESLENAGDSLEESREVTHLICFEDKKKMKKFTKAVEKEGFTIEELCEKPEEDENYSVRIARNDFVDYDSINEVTDLLIEIAMHYEGEYDGWETIIIK